MQENPYSRAQIQTLLSQYLDGQLSLEKTVEVDSLIERYPEFRDALIKLQALRNGVQEAVGPETQEGLAFSKVSDQVWKNIAKQFDTDQGAPLMEADPEFISAYYDHEIPLDDSRLQAFESQLYRNADANRLLADIGQISEAIRQFGYRLEESCTLDITAQVMQLYQAELIGSAAENPNPAAPEPALDPQLEMLSAYVDQALTPKEIIEANRLIESDPAARQTVAVFNRISEQIQSLSLRIQEQAPDCWPAVQARLESEVAQDSAKVVRFPVRKSLRVAIPAAAAVLLLVFAWPGFHQSNQGTARPAQFAFNGKSNGGSHLAVVPVAQRSNIFRQGAVRQVQWRPEAAESIPVSRGAELGPVASVEPSTASDAVPDDRTGNTPDAPSSEEYLFDALSEQMPAEDISAILGQ